MRASFRFLFVAVAGWALFRGATAGMLPGVEAFHRQGRGRSSADRADPIRADHTGRAPDGGVARRRSGLRGCLWGLSALRRLSSTTARSGPGLYYPASAPTRHVTVPLPPAEPVRQGIEPGPDFYTPIAPLEEWDLAQVAHGSIPGPPRQSSPAPSGLPSFIPQRHLDRMQLSAWALWRGGPGTGSLASGGTLGGSQAGARLTYAIDPRIAASLRTTTPIGGSSGGEVAAGVRLTPFPSLPFAVTAERRQAIGRFSTGRSDFALFAEGGVYQKPLGWNLLLDGYAQAGVVGIRSHDFFADGGLAVSRPVWGRFSAGMGVWGGYQPGLYRVDAGPRISMRVRPNVSLHFDWRQRLAAAAEPGSGPAVTLGANF